MPSLQITLLVLIFTCLNNVAAQQQQQVPVSSMTGKVKHLAHDLLKARPSPRDFAHLDVTQYLSRELAYAAEHAPPQSAACSQRFGRLFVEDQRKHHFKLCTAAGVAAGRASRALTADGKQDILMPDQRAASSMDDVSGRASGSTVSGRMNDTSSSGSSQEPWPEADFGLLSKSLTTDAAAGTTRVLATGPSNSGGSGSTASSDVQCYMQPHGGNKYKDSLTFCVGRNVLLDTCLLYSKRREGFDVRVPWPAKGALKLGCKLDVAAVANTWLLRGMKNEMWWKEAAQDQQYAEVQAGCRAGAANVVEHPVVFLVRDRYTHPMHELEMLATLFVSLAVAQLPEVLTSGLQVVIADRMPHAGYRHTYAAVSFPYRLRHLAQDPYPPGTCFRTALFVHAFSNSLPFNTRSEVANCSSPLLVAVHKWVRHLHRELDPEHQRHHHQARAELGGVVRRNVVWMSRRTLEALRTTSSAMSDWQEMRIVANDLALTLAMQRAVHDWNSQSCLLQSNSSSRTSISNSSRGSASSGNTSRSSSEGAAVRRGLAEQAHSSAGKACRDSAVQFDFVFGEFSDVPFVPDQLMILFRSGVLVGVHGAGLTSIFNAPAHSSAVIELVADGLEDKQPGNVLATIPSITHNMGSHYQRLQYNFPTVPPEDLAAALVRAMDSVNAAIVQQRGATTASVTFSDQFNFRVQHPAACPVSGNGSIVGGWAHFAQKPLKHKIKVVKPTKGRKQGVL